MSTAPKSRVPNRRWIWYFVVLALLTIAAVATLIVYNLGQQLKREQLVAARDLWRSNDLKNYQLTYTQKKGNDARAETYVVRVRSGKVVSASLDGRPLKNYSFFGMDALFDYILDFLEQDAKPDRPRTFARARFDPDSGALRDYVRRVMASSERVEIKVDSLVPLED